MWILIVVTLFGGSTIGGSVYGASSVKEIRFNNEESCQKAVAKAQEIRMPSKPNSEIVKAFCVFDG